MKKEQIDDGDRFVAGVGGVDLKGFIRFLWTKAWLLILVPLVAGIAAYFLVTAFVPKSFTSVAYLAVGQSENSLVGSSTLVGLLRSPAVMGVVAKSHSLPSEKNRTQESLTRSLNRNVRFLPAPGLSRRTANLFVLKVNDADPGRAQTINTALIDRLRELSRPLPVQRTQLEEDLKFAQNELETVSGLIEQLKTESPQLVLPSSVKGELATPMVELLKQKAELRTSIVERKRLLNGSLTSDFIISPPNLPSEADSTTRAIVTLGVAILAAVVLFLILFGHYWWAGNRRSV